MAPTWPRKGYLGPGREVSGSRWAVHPGTTPGAERIYADNSPSTQPVYTTPIYNHIAPPHRISLVQNITLTLRPDPRARGHSHTDRHTRLRGHLAQVAMPNMPTVTQTLRPGFSETGPGFPFVFATPQARVLCSQPSHGDCQAPPSSLEAWASHPAAGKTSIQRTAGLLAALITAQTCTRSYFGHLGVRGIPQSTPSFHPLHFLFFSPSPKK